MVFAKKEGSFLNRPFEFYQFYRQTKRKKDEGNEQQEETDKCN